MIDSLICSFLNFFFLSHNDFIYIGVIIRLALIQLPCSIVINLISDSLLSLSVNLSLLKWFWASVPVHEETAHLEVDKIYMRDVDKSEKECAVNTHAISHNIVNSYVQLFRNLDEEVRGR